MKPHLFIGPVDFADPTLLLGGDEQSLLWLANQFESRHITKLSHGHPTFVVSDWIMTLIPVDRGGRLDEQRGQYEWRIDRRQAQDFAERVRVLARSPRPGHAYLDTESRRQILASKGEYELGVLSSLHQVIRAWPTDWYAERQIPFPLQALVTSDFDPCDLLHDISGVAELSRVDSHGDRTVVEFLDKGGSPQRATFINIGSNEWRLQSLKFQCSVCFGSGRNLEDVCIVCQGAGWGAG